MPVRRLVRCRTCHQPTSRCTSIASMLARAAAQSSEGWYTSSSAYTAHETVIHGQHAHANAHAAPPPPPPPPPHTHTQQFKQQNQQQDEEEEQDYPTSNQQQTYCKWFTLFKGGMWKPIFCLASGCICRRRSSPTSIM